MYGTFIVGVCTSYQLYIYSLSPKKKQKQKRILVFLPCMDFVWYNIGDIEHCVTEI